MHLCSNPVGFNVELGDGVIVMAVLKSSRSGWSLADKYMVRVVKALVKLLTNTLKKTLSAFNLPD